MKISDFIKTLNYEVITKSDYNDKEITGCYTGDLLSWVMSKAQSGDVWATVMSNVNIIAVANLTDVSCIVLTEGVTLDEDVLNKANAQDVVILATDKKSSDVAIDYHELNIN